MAKAPEVIRIEYRFNEASGLYAASSPDLKGLHVIDQTKQRVIDRLPEVATELAKAMGFDVCYRWGPAEPGDSIPGWDSVPQELTAAAAPC